MATLQNIRKRGPLVALIIGIALLAFVLGDAVRSGRIFFDRAQYEIAKVGGKSISYMDFAKQVEEVSEIYKMRTNGALDDKTRENLQLQIWEQLIRKTLLDKEFNKLGLSVSPDELFDMVQGQNIDPTIRNLFQNPETGEFNRSLVLQFLKNLDNDPTGNNKAMWLYIEKELLNNRVFNKYINLVRNGVYVNSEETKEQFAEKNSTYDIKFIIDRYASVPDSTIKPSESELKDYYEEHEKEFKQEESRDIEFVTFDVEPTQDDIQESKKWVENLRNEFETTDNDNQFLRLNDPSHAFDQKYYKEKELPTSLQNFASTAKEKEIFGPFMENKAYKMAKITKRINLPDSVKARHILLTSKSPTNEIIAKMKGTLDSLKLVIKKGGDFAKLAEQYSQDGSAKKGGDLGWFKHGQMVPEFSDSCFFGTKGDLKIVITRFGAHLIEIQEKGKDTMKFQVAILTRDLEPSKTTRDNIYSKAMKFASALTTGASFDQIANDQKLEKKPALNVSPLEKNIAGLESAREFIRAAYGTPADDIIKDDKKNIVFEIGNKYVVGKVIAIKEAGTATFEQTKSYVAIEVIKKKKAEKMIEKFRAKMSGVNNIDVLAQSLNLEVKDAPGLNFASYAVAGLGYEPQVIGTASALPKDKISSPIEGKTGVFVIVVTNVNPTGPAQDINVEKSTLIKSARSLVNYQAYDAIKEASKIEDKRGKYF